MSWLEKLDELTKEQECPRSYIFWGGIAAISAVVAPNIWMNRKGKFRTIPNLFILLVGRSSLGKGFAPNLAQRVVTEVNNTRVISGRSTIEFIIKTLSEPKIRTGHLPIDDARGFVVSGEFSASMQRNPDAFSVLTDLFDSNYNAQKWNNSLKTAPVEELKRPCLTIFSGTTPEGFNDFVPEAYIRGGFVSRTLLIHEEKRHGMDYLIGDDSPELDYPAIAAPLQKLSNLKGQMRWSPGAEKYANEWYAEFRPLDGNDKTGFMGRVPDHILKVSMCLALAERPELVINKSHFEAAVRAVTDLIPSVNRLTIGSSDNKNGHVSKRILELILSTPSLSIERQKLLIKGNGDFDFRELDDAILKFKNAGFVDIMKDGAQTLYYVTEMGKKLWRKAQN